jgi:hypothetical protein
MPKSRRSSKPTRSARIAPVFASEVAEREFWETADSTEYVDWDVAIVARFPNLRPSSTQSLAAAGTLAH